MEDTALLVAIIRNAIDGIITMDDEGRIELVNPAGSKLFGYPVEKLIGKQITLIIPAVEVDPELTRDKAEQLPWKAIYLGKVAEVNGLRQDGSRFALRLCISEVSYFGRTIYTAFTHDMSKQKLAEDRLREYAAQLEQEVEDRTQSLKDTVHALRQAKEDISLSLKKEKELGLLKNRFVSMASHEFRTPLSAVQLSASLIEKYADHYKSPNITKHVHKIKNVVANLTTILNDFLSLEKLEAGKVEATLSRFDIIKLAEELTEEMQMVAKQNQQILYTHQGPNPEILLDQNLLKNCIINLISNAIKYSGEDTLIDFRTEINETSFILRISDNGIGIPEIDQKHLFEAFFRAQNTGSIPGTGLGLNIVAQYTTLMKGNIRFMSNVNQGTLFTLTFPLSSPLMLQS